MQDVKKMEEREEMVRNFVSELTLEQRLANAGSLRARGMALLEGIARGERAFSEGQIVTHGDAKKRLGRWLCEPR